MGVPLRLVRCGLALVFLLAAIPVMAQSPLLEAPDSETRVELPEELTPAVISDLLSRLTDDDVRAVLRAELLRQAEAQAAEDDGETAFTAFEARISEMAMRIRTRVERWTIAIADLGARRERVQERLSTAEAGVPGMLVAAGILVLSGLGAGVALVLLTRRWRRWLCAVEAAGYWERVVRTILLAVLEFLPVFAFVAATRLLAPVLAARLGPLTDMVWIYWAGVAWSWGFIVLARRAFAPDAPQIRIAPLADEAAQRLHRLLVRCVVLGAAGWLVAGMFPTLGYGFPPAMVTVAIAGTGVALLLLFMVLRNIPTIRAAIADALGDTASTGALGRVAVATAPWLLTAYLVGAGAYWVAHWLERGQHRLDGPIGTLLVLLVLPIFDRLGGEVIRSCIPARSDMSERFRKVFWGAWRVLIGFGAGLIVLKLWGLDLLTLAMGEDASPTVSALLQIMATLAIGYLIWRLIAAALYTEMRVSDAAEDASPEDVPAATRLHTLTPLFRNFLLGVLAIVVVMVVLSDMGVDIGPLIASAGVVGIAIGFGAQALVRDIFSGIFFLIDDAFRVGEYIELETDLRGEVESISIRSLQLRHHRGPVITIPFGELKKITNHNRDWVIYKMSFRMEPETDPQRFKKLVKEVGKEFLAHPEHGPKFLEPLKSQGVYYVDDDSALVMRVKFKCKPRAQFVLRREIYHRLRAVFAENELYLARRKVEVVGAGEGDAQAKAVGEAIGGAAAGALEAATPQSG